MRKNISLLLAAIVLLITMSSVAFAASETKDLFMLDKSYNMAVSILFDKEMPTVSFTAPDGTVIDGYSLRYDSGEDWVQFYILNAAVGQWMITYDKKSNSQLTINYSSYMESISINNFAFEAASNNNIPVHFSVTGDSTDNYQWQIYAVVTENGSVVGERLLTEGSASLGDVVNRDVYVGDLSDYANYQLRLDIWQRNGVEEVYDSRIADGSFAIIGHTSGDAIDDFRVELNITDGELLIDWSEWARGGGYIVAVFDLAQSGTEPIYFTEVTDGSNKAEALFDPATDNIRIDLTGRSWNQNTPTKSKTISINNGVIINTFVSELTNSSQAKVEYEVPQSITADVIVNSKSEKVNLSGSGNFSLNLPETYNEAEIRYSLTDANVIYIVKFQATVDNIPPILRLPENKTALSVDSDEYKLVGVTEADAILKVNDEVITINTDGTFVHTISLANGENILKVTATDWAGNITSQDVIINRVNGNKTSTMGADANGWGFVERFLPLIISFIVSLALFLTILFVSKGYGKTKNKRLYILRVLRNIDIIIGSLCLLFGGYFLWKYIALSRLSESEDYFALALKSIDEAYAALQDAAFCLQMLKALGIAIGICLLIAVLLGYIIKLMKHRAATEPINADESTRITSETHLTQTESVADSAVSADDKDDIPVTSTTEGLEGEPTSEPTIYKPETYVCPICGATYGKLVKFCGKCGNTM